MNRRLAEKGISISLARATLAFALVVSFSVMVLGHFHDRFWLPRDDGYYAHIAQRILDGDVLHRDVQGLHMGLVYFANAAALWLFGPDFVSLRYPLVALGLIQACLMFFLFLPRGTLTAVAASIALTSMSFVQFVNPTAHWYCLFLFVVIVCALHWIPPAARWRLEILGFLIVTLLLFRQLTGVFVAIGVLAFLMLEASSKAGHGERLVARVLVTAMIAVLAAYLVSKTDALGWLLFGFWPLAILVRVWFSVNVPGRDLAQLLLRLGLGGAIAAAPLTVYHALTGSLWHWFDDTVIHALALSEFEYIGRPSYAAYLVLGPLQLIRFDTLTAALNGLFWLILCLLPSALGILAIRRFSPSENGEPTVGALPFLAVFYALISLHYQVEDYLFFEIGVVIPGLLWFTGRKATSWRRVVPATLVCALSAVALYYHAAQPFSRGGMGIITGKRVRLSSDVGLARASLKIEASDLALYQRIMRLIENEVPAEGAILAVPANADLYFLSQRRNPLPYAFISFGILDDETLRAALKTLERDSPTLVFHVPHLPYNTPYTEAIMDAVRRRYVHFETMRPFEIYRLVGATKPPIRTPSHE